MRHFVTEPAQLRSRADQLWSWLRQGDITVRVGHTYRLTDVASAHRDLETRQTTGKVLLIP